MRAATRWKACCPRNSLIERGYVVMKRISYFEHEAELFRMERTTKRLMVLVLVMVALCFSSMLRR